MGDNGCIQKHIVLSRKGFDSAAGGNASMIISKGKEITIQPLPIPDERSEMSYKDVRSNLDCCLEALMDAAGIIPKLKRGKGELKEVYTCHRDPDIFCDTEHAAFGQMGNSESHLYKHQVGEGDLFLFFGWYKHYEFDGNMLTRKRDMLDDRHVIYGFMFVDKVYDLTVERELKEASVLYSNHPHCILQKEDIENKINNNRLYTAAKTIPGTTLPGFGIFNFDEDLILSKDNMTKSKWRIDENSFMGKYVKGREISHHSNKSRHKDYFQSVARGQEFVMTLDENDELWSEIIDFVKRHVVVQK